MFKIINPLDYPGWDELLLKTPDSSFFHSSQWARVLHESYNYKPLYFSSINDNAFRTLIPLMEVRSILTGKRGVSLPFTDYCEPIMTDNESFQASLNMIIEYGRKAGWKSIEMRTGNSFPRETSPFSYYCGHTLNLTMDNTFKTQQATGDIKNPSFPPFAILRPFDKLTAQDDKCHGELVEPSPPLVKGPACRPSGRGKGGLSDENKIFSNFRDSTRRNIRKAINEGVEVTINNSWESIKEFYRLNCLTRREHGLPPQPYYFLKKFMNTLFPKISVLLHLHLMVKKPLPALSFSILEKKRCINMGLRTNTINISGRTTLLCGKQ